MANRRGKVATVTDFIFLSSKITAVTAAMKLKDAPWKKSYDKPRLRTKKQRHHFADIVKSYGFSSSHMQTWESDHKEGWVPKNWGFQTVVLKTSESLIQQWDPVNPKGNQSWVFIGRTDTETPILCHLIRRANSWKRPWCWERLRAGGEEGDRRGDSWMASLTQRTWLWANSGR